MRGDSWFEAAPCTDSGLEALYIRSCLADGSPNGKHLVDDQERLDLEDVHGPSHRAILATIFEMADSRKRPYESDIARTLKGEERDVFERLMQSSSELQPPAKVAQELKALAKRRRMHAVAMRIAQSLEKGDVDQARELFLEGAADSGSDKRVGEYMQAAEAIEAAHAFSRRTGSMRTGFHLLDRAIGQLRPSTMTVIGGYEGTRKSSFMLSMAMNLTERGIACGIVSLEDPAEVYGPRVLAHLVSVNPREFDGSRGPVFEANVQNGIKLARERGLYFAFEEQQPINKVLAAIRHLVRKCGCKVIFVDYLQCVRGREEKRSTEVANACARIKGQCQRLGVACVIGSQLNNPEKGKEFKQPNNTSLKESGDIKDMAEVILLLWKKGDSDNEPTHFKLSKCKWSPDRPSGVFQTNPETGAVVGLANAAS